MNRDQSQHEIETAMTRECGRLRDVLLCLMTAAIFPAFVVCLVLGLVAHLLWWALKLGWDSFDRD